ncbi:MAG: EF-P lysine aminoacylase EpmA [Marinobacterium sp.]|nr:EF-P lysine aminoacylase EpmA [Marinobacterium sp.]
MSADSSISSDWQPTASVENLRRRGRILAQIRQFFAQRDVLEVEVPLMSHCAVSDPFIDSIEVEYRAFPQAQAEKLYLQTSPEYAMKRLLAAGSGAIYQLSRAFRNGECGSRHNPEFSMLEWYRPGFDDQQLMDEVAALVMPILGLDNIERLSYQQAFEQCLGINPHTASLEQLIAVTRTHIDVAMEDSDRDSWLNLLMSHVVEPALAEQGAVFICDYPASQAALSKIKIDDSGRTVATRFELFINGIELANGYHELTDSTEQARRLDADQQQRAALALPQRPLENRLVAALEAGIPDCAGVALGVDRLVMLALGEQRIDQVIAFPFERA